MKKYIFTPRFNLFDLATVAVLVGLGLAVHWIIPLLLAFPLCCVSQFFENKAKSEAAQ